MLCAIKIKIKQSNKEKKCIMKLKRMLSIMGMCAVLSATSVTAFAAEMPHQLVKSVDEENVIQPRVKWTGKARLGTKVYYNVTSSNNIFKDSPKVTNHAGNPGAIKVRIVNSDGKQVGATKEIAAGKTVTMDSIPAFSGTYTLQAMALDKEGSYTITID